MIFFNVQNITCSFFDIIVIIILMFANIILYYQNVKKIQNKKLDFSKNLNIKLHNNKYINSYIFN